MQEERLADTGAARQAEASATAGAAPSGTEKVKRTKRVPHWLLDLSGASAIRDLWLLYNEERSQAGESPLPQLRLALDDIPIERDFPFIEMDAEHEIMYALVGLENKAAARLKKLQERKPDGPPIMLPAEPIVHIAENGMLAWILLYPAMSGGKPLGIEDVAAALRRAGVTVGVDMDFADQCVQENRIFQLIPVAWGTTPVEGEDGSVIEHYAREYVREMRADKQGNVDYREQCYVRTIRKGDVICDIIPPTPGIHGTQVTGKTTKAHEVKAAKAPGGKNTSLVANGLQLVAAMDGHLEFSGSAFHIKPTLEIPSDVDYSTGNISFLGDVHIRGDVRENFVVRATGSITIDGIVEGAQVEADGDILISKGVFGDSKAVIKSRKNVHAKYLENCTVYAGECVQADSMVFCNVYSDNAIKAQSGRGTIIGGVISAACTLDANVIGTPSGRRTEIVLGRMPNVEDERKIGEKELKAIRRELDETKLSINYMEKRQRVDPKDERLAKLRLRKSVLGMKQDKLSKRMVELEAMTPDITLCRLHCGMLYPPATITVGKAVRTITNEWKSCMAYYSEEDHDVAIT